MNPRKDIKVKEWYLLLNDDELKKLPRFNYMIHGMENGQVHVLVSFRKPQNVNNILSKSSTGSSARPCRVNQYSKRYMKRNLVDAVEVNHRQVVGWY